jgi:hypothetical protein
MTKRQQAMNNRHIISLISACTLLLAAVLLFCREHNPAENGLSDKKTAVGDSVDFESLMNRLRDLQDTMYADPANSRLIPPLVKAAFDSTTGCFHVVGKGCADSSYPAAAVKALQKTAARNDAMRWALYLKSWRRGDMRPLSRQVRGEIAYSRVLFEKDTGDTLYQLLQVPIGSIVVK